MMMIDDDDHDDDVDECGCDGDDDDGEDNCGSIRCHYSLSLMCLEYAGCYLSNALHVNIHTAF